VDSRNLKFLHRTALLHLFAALLFFAFFQLGKISPFHGVNPFSEDPYDAVGSFAIELALFAGVLSYTVRSASSTPPAERRLPAWSFGALSWCSSRSRPHSSRTLLQKRSIPDLNPSGVIPTCRSRFPEHPHRHLRTMPETCRHLTCLPRAAKRPHAFRRD